MSVLVIVLLHVFVGGKDQGKSGRERRYTAPTAKAHLFWQTNVRVFIHIRQLRIKTCILSFSIKHLC